MFTHSLPRARGRGHPVRAARRRSRRSGRAGVRRTVGPGAGPGPATGGPGAAPSKWHARPEQYPGTAKTTDIPITMDDGVVLRGDLIQPANAEGEAIDKKLPVIVMITAYNKTVISRGHRRARRPGPDVPGQARLQLPLRRRPRHRQLRGHLGGVQRPGEQGRRQDRRLGAPPVVEQRQGRHGRRVLHGHQPADGRRPPPAGPQGDLPAGARRRRLPRHRRVRRPARRRLHPAVAGPGQRHRPDPAGLPLQRSVVGHRSPRRAPDRQRDVHDDAGAAGAARRQPDVRRPVLPRAVGDRVHRPGEGADLPRRR